MFSINKNRVPAGAGLMFNAGAGIFKDPRATAVIANGILTSITLNIVGSWFTATPTVAIGTVVAKVNAVPGTVEFNSTGAVTAVPVTTAGHFYTVAPAVTFSGGGGTNAAATAVLSNGGVASITVTAGGTGYTSAPTAAIAAAPTAHNATATAVLGSGRLLSIALGGTNTGYTSAPVITFTGGGGAGATAHAIVNTYTGKVTSLSVDNPGSGYTSVPTVVVTGGGYTAIATGTALVGFQVASLTVTAGDGYTAVPLVSFTDKPPVELIQTPCYVIESAPNISILGPSGSDEVVKVIYPKSNDDLGQIGLGAAPNGFIGLARTATTLTVDLNYSASWFGR